MRALLVTRCGCSQVIEVHSPPPMVWDQLLPPTAPITVAEADMEHYTVRRFVREAVHRNLAIYEEEITP